MERAKQGKKEVARKGGGCGGEHGTGAVSGHVPSGIPERDPN